MFHLMETLFSAFLSSTHSAQHVIDVAATSPGVFNINYDDVVGKATQTAMADRHWELVSMDSGRPENIKKQEILWKRSFLEYFKHHLMHITLQRRTICLVDFETKCCFQLGQCVNPNHSQKDLHLCCCSPRKSLAESSEDVVSCEERKKRNCVCGHNKDYLICQLHNLFITDFESTQYWCSWSVSFVDDSYIACNIGKDSDMELDFVINDVDSIYIDTSLHGNLSLVSHKDWDNASVMYDMDSDEDANDIVCFDISVDASNRFFFNLDRNPVEKSYLSDVKCGMKSKYDHVTCIKENVVETISTKRKNTRFADDSSLVTIHYMFVWNYAYKQSRKSVWVEAASNRSHFNRRIETTSKILEPVLRQHLTLIESSS